MAEPAPRYAHEQYSSTPSRARGPTRPLGICMWTLGCTGFGGRRYVDFPPIRTT